MSNPKRGIEIDYDKLESALKQRGETSRSAAIKMGYSEYTLCRSKVDGALSLPMARMIESMFNIKIDDIKPDEPEPEKPVEMPRNDVRADFELIKEDLYQLIYTAVYNAVDKAWRAD